MIIRYIIVVLQKPTEWDKCYVKIRMTSTPRDILEKTHFINGHNTKALMTRRLNETKDPVITTETFLELKTKKHKRRKKLEKRRRGTPKTDPK